MEKTETGEPTVVCICGVLAAGKTTLIRSLSGKLTAPALVIFDEYEAFCEWPDDFAQWIAEGADPACVGNPRLRQDLEALLAGQSIKHPLDERTISPSSVILLEDPFGRTRPDISGLIDLVLFVDLPTDLSVVRMARRALGLDAPPASGDLSGLANDEILERVETADRQLNHYAQNRRMYTVLIEPVRSTADVILDGTKPMEVMLLEALEAISQKM
ncbi:hypothetical protein ACFLSZ_06165 [Candidatus Bipolaricaulota bacterium]